MKNIILIVFGLSIVVLVICQIRINKNLITAQNRIEEYDKKFTDIEREQNEVRDFLLQEFGPCFGIPNGECME